MAVTDTERWAYYDYRLDLRKSQLSPIKKQEERAKPSEVKLAFLDKEFADILGINKEKKSEPEQEPAPKGDQLSQ